MRRPATYHLDVPVEIPNINVLLRTLWIRSAGSHGTGFTVEVDDRQFLVTAAHVVPSKSEVEAYLDGGWRVLRGRYIPPDPDYVDVAVFELEVAITPTHPTTFGVEGAMLGQELFILGYPFDPSAAAELIHQEGLGPLPMVKGGRLAAWLHAPGPGRNTMLVDCYANEGFSGGPVVGFLPAPGAGNARRAVGILGVVSHYVPEHQPVIDFGRADRAQRPDESRDPRGLRHPPCARGHLRGPHRIAPMRRPGAAAPRRG